MYIGVVLVIDFLRIEIFKFLGFKKIFVKNVKICIILDF